MRRLSLVALFAYAFGVLSACQVGTPPAAKGDDVTANAVAGSAIEVSALDAPKADAPPVDAAQPAAPEAEALATEPAAAEAPAPATAEEPAVTPEKAEAVAPPKSDAQLACEKKGSKWFKIGDGEKYGCVRETRDSGKRCERESQCDGVCLARSGTCSPFKPLYGCNEILQDDGARVTLCLD